MDESVLLDLINLVPALGVTFVFIWYELKRQSQWSEERRDERREREAERSKRDEEWRSFLTEQRSATLATLDVLAMRLQQLGDVVMGIDDRTRRIEKAFEFHDTRAEHISIAVEGLRTQQEQGHKRFKSGTGE